MKHRAGIWLSVPSVVIKERAIAMRCFMSRFPKIIGSERPLDEPSGTLVAVAKRRWLLRLLPAGLTRVRKAEYLPGGEVFRARTCRPKRFCSIQADVPKRCAEHKRVTANTVIQA